MYFLPLTCKSSPSTAGLSYNLYFDNTSHWFSSFYRISKVPIFLVSHLSHPLLWKVVSIKKWQKFLSPVFIICSPSEELSLAKSKTKETKQNTALFLFGFIPLNKHGCLVYWSYMTFIELCECYWGLLNFMSL